MPIHWASANILGARRKVAPYAGFAIDSAGQDPEDVRQRHALDRTPPVQFTRLRLNGFKSFVDPTDLLIARGLTGVVGPNGCGKSNLLEALRWVMGENRPTAT